MPPGLLETTLLTDALKLCVQIASRVAGRVRINASFDDRPGATTCPSRPQLSATAMSVAVVPDATAYKDSGQRYFLSLEKAVTRTTCCPATLEVLCSEASRSVRISVMACCAEKR